MDVLLLRFEAPLLSFGAPIVDNLGVIQPFPALSMIVGLFGNALGWEHREHAALDELQARVRYAARCDRPGRLITDYQTVDLEQSFLIDKNTAWTTRGHVDERGKGAATRGTHIRYRDYWADSVHTVAVALAPAEPAPTVRDLAAALNEPARPLFVGRKCCLPSRPLLLGVTDAPSALAALCRTPRADSDPVADGEPHRRLPAWWFAEEEGEGVPPQSRLLVVTDERDWRNQVHGGERPMRHGLIDPPRAPAGGEG